MKNLIIAILKIFFRNPRTIFFVILLPAGLFMVVALLGLQGVVRFDLPVSYHDFLLSGILAMALMQSGIYTLGYMLIDYRRTGIFKRLSVTPLSPGKFWAAQILARFLIALLQAAALLILGRIFFQTSLHNLFVVVGLVLLGNTLFLNFGFIISAIARDYEEAAPYTTIIGLPLVFLGDVFFPAQNLPHGLATLADYLPLKPLSATIRHFLLATPVPNLAQDVWILLIWLAVLSFFAWYLFGKKVYK